MNKAIFLNSINSILVPILTNFLLIKNNFVYGNTGLSGFIFDYQVTAIVQLLPRLFNPLTVIKKIIVNVNFIRNKFIRFICSNP
jgi:hypothetical protein